MKRIFAAIAVSYLLLTCIVFAETKLLVGTDYFKTTLEEIEKAEESIYVVMYLIMPKLDDPQDAPLQLINALNRASKRNLKVTVIMEEKKQNKKAFELLAPETVHFSVPNQFIHTKAIVIDKEISILGSHNWTPASLAQDGEVSVLIRDADFAQELFSSFLRIQRTEAMSLSKQGVKLAYSFFVGAKSKGSLMFSNDAEKRFDLYLYLLRDWAENNNGKIMIDLAKYAKRLDLSQDHLQRMLRRVESEDQLVQYTAIKPGWAEVVLLQAGPVDDYIEVPKSFWDYGYIKKLSFKAKYFYLINLRETKISKEFPWWQRSVNELSKRYGMANISITQASLELRRQDIIEIHRTNPLNMDFFWMRDPNSYLLKELREDKERERQFRELKGRFSPKLVKQAQEFADQLNEPNDIAVIEDFIRIIQKYGYEKVKEANAITAKLVVNNAKRHIGYTIVILRRLYPD